jgi:hypothetical protein
MFTFCSARRHIAEWNGAPFTPEAAALQSGIAGFHARSQRLPERRAPFSGREVQRCSVELRSSGVALRAATTGAPVFRLIAAAGVVQQDCAAVVHGWR